VSLETKAPPAATPPQNREEIARELKRCASSRTYFVNHYVKIYDAQEKAWIAFELWPEQADILDMFETAQLSIVLKARQLGLTWLALAYILWQMLFRPIAACMVFSRRDEEAIYLLGEERLRGMYRKLPHWMQARETLGNSAHIFALSNGSTTRAFPTSAGDSYTSTCVFIDEADIILDLNRLMRAVKPTIDAGGKMILVSRSDKSRPRSEFKNIYTAAVEGTNGWNAVFLPWWTRPSRTLAWYNKLAADIQQRTGSLDELHEQYPASDVEALAPRTKDKRIPPDWVTNCYEALKPIPLDQSGAPNISGLTIYRLPITHRQYVMGGDPAEGNPNSNESALHVLDKETGEEVAALAGLFEPTIFAVLCAQIANYYNGAGILPERNNHGHQVIGWLVDNKIKAGYHYRVLYGRDGKLGWLSNSVGKTLLYDDLTDCFRTQDTVIHSLETVRQIQSIEGATLLAPEGEADDRADAYALAYEARTAPAYSTVIRTMEYRE
jgi:hypothetical protein